MVLIGSIDGKHVDPYHLVNEKTNGIGLLIVNKCCDC